MLAVTCRSGRKLSVLRHYPSVANFSSRDPFKINKDGDSYIARMNQTNKDKIGSKSLIDK